MASTAKKLATYQDVLAAPAHQVAQLVHGELVAEAGHERWRKG